MLCCSSVCEQAAECGRHVRNDRSGELQQVENLDSFGSASISAEGIKESYWCGEKGDWRMFEKVADNKTE